MKKSAAKVNKSYTTKVRIMDLFYSKLRKEWDGAHDDRIVFCNVYDMLMESLEVMKDIDNNHIWVAFNRQWDEDRQLMNDIAKEFGIEI